MDAVQEYLNQGHDWSSTGAPFLISATQDISFDGTHNKKVKLFNLKDTFYIRFRYYI